MQSQSDLIKRITPASAKDMEGLPVEDIITNMQNLEQYVKTVIKYTSRYNIGFSFSYSPENLVGTYAIYPTYGDFPESYILRSYGKWQKESESYQKNYMPQDVDPYGAEDYVTLGFGTPIVPRHVWIYEIYNPGAVVRIWGRYTAGSWKMLWEGPPQHLPPEPRKFQPPIKKYNCLINEIRLEFNQSHLKYHTSIDAVLLGGLEPIYKLHYNILRNDLLKFPKWIAKDEQMEKDDDSQLKIDLFSTLPYEVILHIFQYLDLKSLSRCAQVNKTWYDATLDPILYQNLSLKRYWHKVNDKTLNYFSNRCRGVKKLDLSWCNPDDPIEFSKQFNSFLQKCNNLTHLSLCHTNFLDFHAMESIGNCHDLIELRLVNVKLSNGFFELSNLTKLQTLDVSLTNINGSALLRILRSNRKLKHLLLDFCDNLMVLDEIVQTVAECNTELCTWSSFKTISLMATGAAHFAACSNLTELDLGGCFAQGHPGDCLERIAKSCKRLKRLIISQWRAMNDQMLEAIITNCKELVVLDFGGNKIISTEMCERALIELKQLRLLEISFCDSISKESINHWRFIYPHVTIQRSCQNNFLL